MYDNDFDGVFRFTNATDEEFVFLWNNKEYVFPPQSCCPLIIGDETLENIQSIRKKAAYKLATREFYKGREYKRLKKLGESTPSGMPPTFDDKVLQPWIDECLKPLPQARAAVKVRPKDSDKNYKASKAVGKKDTLVEVFKDDAPEELGEMPDTMPVFNK